METTKRGGAILRKHKNKDFGTIPFFLEIANVGEAYLIFERISVVLKVYSTNRPNRLKTLLKVFWQFKTLLKVFCFRKTLLKFICWACSGKTLLCFAMLLTIAITSVPYIPYCYAQIILSTKDDLRPHRLPPLPLSVPCWHRHHRCHGCRVVATIATVAIAAATATAAVISATTSTVSAAIATVFWLIVLCPCAASASATVACPRRCHRWLSTPLPLSPRPQTAAP